MSRHDIFITKLLKVLHEEFATYRRGQLSQSQSDVWNNAYCNAIAQEFHFLFNNNSTQFIDSYLPAENDVDALITMYRLIESTTDLFEQMIDFVCKQDSEYLQFNSPRFAELFIEFYAKLLCNNTKQFFTEEG